MSNNIILNGTVYNGVEKVNLPLVGGGTACFVDGSASGGTLNISENGMYDVSGYEKVLVNVSGGATLRSVSLNGAHVSFSNTNTYVANGAAYENTVIPNSRYSVSGLTVRMGGVDISATAVSGNRISIASVTGDIVITAETTADGLLFQMGQRTFNGTSDYVNTGVKLMERDTDWTVCIDFLYTYSEISAVIFHCMDESASPWPGVALNTHLNASSQQTRIRLSGMGEIIIATSANPQDLNGNYRVVVVHHAGDGFVSAYSNGTYLGNSRDDGTYPIVSKTLLIGAYRGGADDTGTLGRYFKGTVNKAEVWNYAMTAAEATAWA